MTAAHNGKLLRSVTLAEAKANPDYWDLIQYRTERLSKLVFFGSMLNVRFINEFLQSNPHIPSSKSDEIADVMLKRLNAVLLMANDKRMINLERIAFSRMSKNEVAVLDAKSIPDERLKKLMFDFTDMKRISELQKTGLAAAIKNELNDIIEHNLDIALLELLKKFKTIKNLQYYTSQRIIDDFKKELLEIKIFDIEKIQNKRLQKLISDLSGIEMVDKMLESNFPTYLQQEITGIVNEDKFTDQAIQLLHKLSDPKKLNVVIQKGMADIVKQEVKAIMKEFVSDEDISKLVIPDDRLENLTLSMSKLREIWKMEIHSDRLMVHFMQETVDDTEMEIIAKKIKANLWKELDYQNPYFKHDLYKAFRKNKINKDELFYGEILHAAAEQFGGSSLQFHSYQDEKAPYQVKQSITYIKDDDLRDFYAAVNNLDVNQQNYATIDLTPKAEAVYFYEILSDSEERLYYLFFREDGSIWEEAKLFLEALKNYVEKLKHTSMTTDENKLLLIEAYTKFKAGVDTKVDDWGLMLLARSMLEEILKHIPDFIPFLKCELTDIKYIRERDSYYHIVARQFLHDQSPCLSVQPFNPERPDASILKSVIPSPASFMALLNTLFHEHVMHPVRVAGKMTTRKMKKTEQAAFGKTRNISAFPPEVVVPKAHGAHMLNFAFIDHDFYLHLFRASAIPFNKLTTHVMTLFEREKSIQMSKEMWRQIDKDFAHMTILFETKLKQRKFDSEMMENYIKDNFLSDNDFLESWAPADKSDDNLLIIVDMIRNEKLWNDALAPVSVDILMSNLMYSHRQIFLNKILAACPDKSHAFCVAAFRMLIFKYADDNEFENRLGLLKAIDQDPAFKPKPSPLSSKLSQALAKTRDQYVKRGMKEAKEAKDAVVKDEKALPHGLGNLSHFIKWRSSGDLHLAIQPFTLVELNSDPFAFFVNFVASSSIDKIDSLSKKTIDMIGKNLKYITDPEIKSLLRFKTITSDQLSKLEETLKHFDLALSDIDELKSDDPDSVKYMKMVDHLHNAFNQLHAEQQEAKAASGPGLFAGKIDESQINKFNALYQALLDIENTASRIKFLGPLSKDSVEHQASVVPSHSLGKSV